jgi:hypothetical protein
MPEPVLVPPTPTINQPNGPVDNSPGLEQVQRAFDQAYPDLSKPKPNDTTPVPAEEPKPATTPPPESPPPQTPPEEHKIPSFLEDALKPEPPKVEIADPEADFPDDLPQEQKTSRIKGLREAYKKLKTEVQTLRNTPNRDPQEQAKLQWLENQNKQMAEVLSRVGVEHSAEFQQNIMRPLTASWNEAARIVRDSGADPQELAKVMSLSGRAQFEGLDNLFSDMPESAKAEAHDALRAYRRFEAARQHAVANAPKTLEAIQQRETERQYQEVSKQRSEMQNMFERAVTRLRDEAKVELFQKTTDPEGQWWNKQGEDLIEQGRSLFLENTDMDKVALACVLAPTADAYRKLFLTSQKKVTELQQFIKERIGNEPNLSESSGNAGGGPAGSMSEDLKKPFADVFLREFHRAQSRNR